MQWPPYGAHILQGLLINQSVNHQGVCRTAPATPGLLNTVFQYFLVKIQNPVVSVWYYHMPFLVMLKHKCLPTSDVNDLDESSLVVSYFSSGAAGPLKYGKFARFKESQPSVMAHKEIRLSHN